MESMFNKINKTKSKAQETNILNIYEFILDYFNKNMYSFSFDQLMMFKFF